MGDIFSSIDGQKYNFAQANQTLRKALGETILVTGATGMLGAHVLYELVNAGHEAKAVYRTSVKHQLTATIFGYFSNDLEALLQRVN